MTRLHELLEADHPRIVRHWLKRLRFELQGVNILPSDLRAPLNDQLVELARLLAIRGEDAVRLWPESIRLHGARRYSQHFDAEDLAREYKALEQVLFRAYVRRFGALDVEAAELIADLTGEAVAAVQGSFARVLRTEEVRFRNASLMESVLQHVEVGIWVAEPDGTLSYATPPVARLLGLPLRRLVGLRAKEGLAALLTQLKARHLNDTPFRASDMPFFRALKEHVAVRDVWMKVTRPNGDDAVLEMSATPLWEEDQAADVAGVIQAMSDRTETARKSQELARAYADLQQLQGRLLQKTRTQALGQLASGAAHALNNFLNVLRLRITLLRREFKPEHLDALDRTVGNIGELVSRLQEFSVERTEEDLQDVDFTSVVRDALELAKGELVDTPEPVTLETQLASEGSVRVDAGFFRELIVNLLLAARERMPHGGAMNVTCHGKDGWLSLDIEDSGTPYGSEELQRLFDPLKGKGSAPQLTLLLAIARNQVQRWGGELTCDNATSTLGGAFHLRLPVDHALAHPPLGPPAVPSLPRGRRSGSHSVLVVDDEAENGRMMAEVLTEEGYKVEVAHSGDEALRLWEGHTFDAALLDALMPDMSGWELARELRKRSPGVLLAMVTGMDVRGQNRSNLALVDAVFRKPVDVSALDEFLAQSPTEDTSLHAPASLH